MLTRPPTRSRRPEHQTVAAYLALVLVLVTGTAYAAATIDSGDVVNNSLKSKDLKNNAAVKGADVRNNNLRGVDFGSGPGASIRGGDVGSEALGGTQFNEASLSASRVVARLGGAVGQPIPNAGPVPIPYPNNLYTQPANEPQHFIGGGRITFSAACMQPRSAVIYLLVDNPVLTGDSFLGVAQVFDSSAGAVTEQFTFAPLAGPPNGMALASPGADTPRALFLQADASCNAGSGVTLDAVATDVVGNR
jgi:hypothetical protein